MPTAVASAAIEDYLKALFALGLEQSSAGVSTTAIADRLGVSPASATNMLKRLDAMGLVTHVLYKGAVLTPSGRKVALEVVRHHRLIETYLAEALGVPWDRVHDEAEVLEHVLSEDLEERIAERLGDPTADPHGHPIPTRDGDLPEASRRSLWQAAPEETVLIERVSDKEPDVLRYLGDIGLTPGTRVEVIARAPVGGPLFVRLADDEQPIAISRELAEDVWVR